MIYLDNNATTKPFPEVVETMMEFMASHFWNSSSAYGQVNDLEGTVESAKVAIRTLSGVGSGDEVVFNSGATESNVWALTEGARRAADGGWLLSSQIEHPSVRETLEHFRVQKLPVRWVPVTRDGVVDLDELKGLVDPHLRFFSMILAHNETGVIQPLSEATAIIRERSPECLIHTDATQALGKMPISFSDDLCEVDLISFSGHKFHGPKGIGGLIIRNGVLIEPMLRGGGQQNALRSGTLNIPAIAGTGIAANRCWEVLQERQHEAVRTIRDHFEERICSVFPSVFILGRHAPRLTNTSFFGIPGTDADDLVLALAAKGIAVSKGSACCAQSIEPSRSAAQMGYSYEEASSLIRFSASFETTPKEVVLLIEELQDLCRQSVLQSDSGSRLGR